ncbi:plasminogen activator, urokinase receptor, isoform CRA_a [Mus musculus]|uniref:Plasminogen activator, urokinase receptor n=1 Tax=Mus musculus TaxID=10090 RepID=A0A0U1RNN0_MOUSE|nr:plasminogen activator, urokinase receptor, isoform CRA_a [Mus musculus]EDL24336.1 plasminogen activator, urokinase receptor, isoform CRA_a [Mus musculus]
MGLPRRLLLLLLLATTCVPASQGLQCMQCESNQSCLVEECALGQDLCRTTVLREWQDDRELEVVTRGCAHSEKTNRTMSYRMGSMIISLTETVCATNLCNRPRPGARGRAFPQGRYLECASCTSLDQSCERGREQSLQCRYPTEHCIEVVTLQSTESKLPSAGQLLVEIFKSWEQSASKRQLNPHTVTGPTFSVTGSSRSLDQLGSDQEPSYLIMSPILLSF